MIELITPWWRGTDDDDDDCGGDGGSWRTLESGVYAASIMTEHQRGATCAVSPPLWVGVQPLHLPRNLIHNEGSHHIHLNKLMRTNNSIAGRDAELALSATSSTPTPLCLLEDGDSTLSCDVMMSRSDGTRQLLHLHKLPTTMMMEGTTTTSSSSMNIISALVSESPNVESIYPIDVGRWVARLAMDATTSSSSPWMCACAVVEELMRVCIDVLLPRDISLVMISCTESVMRNTSNNNNNSHSPLPMLHTTMDDVVQRWISMMKVKHLPVLFAWSRNVLMMLCALLVEMDLLSSANKQHEELLRSIVWLMLGAHGMKWAYVGQQDASSRTWQTTHFILMLCQHMAVMPSSSSSSSSASWPSDDDVHPPTTRAALLWLHRMLLLFTCRQQKLSPELLLMDVMCAATHITHDDDDDDDEVDASVADVEDVLLRCVDEERYVSVMDEVLMTCEWWRGLPPSQLAALCRPPTLAVARSSCQHAYRSIMYYAALTATLARCDVVAAHDDDDDDVDESVLVLKPNEGVRGLASPRVVMEVLAELQHEGGIEGEFFIIAPPIHVLQKHTRTSSSSWELWSMMQTLMIASPHLFDAMLRGVADGASKPHTPAPQRNHFQHVLANTHAQHIIRGILAVRCLTTDKLPLLMEVCTRMSKSCRDPASYMAYMAEMKMMLEMEPMRYFFVSLHHHHHHHHPLGNDGMDMIELLPQVLCALRERRSDGALMDVWPQPLNRDLHAYVKDVVADEDVVGGALRRPTIFAVRLVEWCCAAQPHATFSVVLQHLLADVRHIVKLYGHDGDLVFAMLRPLMCSVLAHGWRSLSTQQEHHYVGVDDDVARNDGEVLLATLMKLLQHITSHASTNAIRASYECLRRLLKCTHKQRHDGGGFFRCGEDDEAQTYVLDAKGEPVDTNWWLVPSPVAYTVAMHAGREEMMMFIAECLRLPLRQHLCGVLERCGVVRLDYNPTSTKNNNTDDDGATIMMIRTRFIMEGSCVAYKIHPPRRKKIIMTTVVERNDDDDDDDDDLVHHHDRLSAALSSAVSGISCITHALQAHAGSNNIAQHVPHLLVLEAAVEYLLTAHADGVDAHDADASMHMVCRRLHALIDTVSGEKKVVLLHLLHGRVRGALAQHTQKQTPHTSETVARVVKSYDVSDVHRNIVSVVGANLQRRLVSSLTERRWSGAAALTALYHHVDVVVVASPHDEHQHQGGTHKLLQSRCKAILSAVGLPTTTRPSSSSSCADVAALSAITAPILATVMEKEALMKLRQQQQHLLHEHHVWLHSSSVTSAVAELLFARRCERQRRAWTHLAYDQKDLLQICVERYLHLCHVGALKALDHHRRDEHRQRVERCRLVSSEEAEVREELEAMYVVEMSSLWRYTRAMLGVCLEESRRRGDLRELEEAVWVGFMDGFVAEERRMLMGDEDEEVWGSTQTHTRNMPASRGAHPVHDEEHPHQHHHLNPTPRLTGGVGLVADAGKNLFGAMRQLQREWVETVAPRPTTHNSTSAHVEEGARGGNSTFTTTSHVGALHAALPNTHTDATLASSSATSAPSPATAVRRKKKGGLGAVAVEMPVPHVDEPDVAATPPHANVAPSATVCEPPDVCDDAEHAPPTSTAPHAPTTSAETGARRKKKGGLGAVSVVANEPTTTATPTEAAGVVPEPTPHVAEVMPVVAVLTTQPNAARVVASESEEHAVAWVPPSAGGDELHVVESVGESHPTPCTTAPHTPTTSTAAVRRKKKGGLGAVAVVVSEPTTTSPLATEAVRVAEMPTPPAHELTSVPDALTHTVEADATTTLVVGDLPVADAAPPTPLEMVPAHAGVAPSRAAVDEVASADVVRATQTPTAPHTPTTSAARTGARRKKKGGLGAVSVVDDEPTTTTTTTTTTEVIQAGDGSALCVKAPEAALALVPNTVGATPVLHVFATTHHHAGVAPSTFADEATPLLPEIDVLMHTVEVDAATSPVVGNGEDELARDAAPAAPREMAPAHADIAPSTPVHELHMATSVDATHTLRTSTASHKKKGLGAVVADLPEPHVNEPLADVVAHTVEADVATPPVVVGLSTVASMNESHPTPCTTDPHTPTTSTAAVRRKKKGGLGAVALTGITAATTHTVDEAPHPSIPPPHVDEVPEPRVLLPATSAPEEMMIHRHAHPFLHQQEDEDDHRITAAANYNREAHHQHQRLTGGVGVLADAGSSMMGALSRWKTSIKETVAPRPHPRSSAVEQQQHAHTQHASVDEVVGGHRDRRASGFSGEKRFE